MTDPIQFDTLLVPVDFSPASEWTFGRALTMVRGENPVLIVLHVIDQSLVDFAAAHGWGSTANIIQKMRDRAAQDLEQYKAQASDTVEVDTIVSEGVPFLEILRKADDFAVDAIVISKGSNRGPVEKLLFGSTAEKILRGSRHPVLVLPYQES